MSEENRQGQGSQSKFPDIKAVKPTDDTAYIQPVIGKLGWDTRPGYKGLFGLGTSPNNGIDFHVFLTFHGLNFDDDAIDNIWNNGAADKVKQEIDSATAEIPDAVSAANEAVKRADSAVAASKVNSDAIAAQSAATSEAIASAASALAYANSAMKDTAKLSSDLASASAAMANEAADIRKDFSDGLKSAQAAVDDVKVVVAANSAAIIKNKNSIELQQQTASSAIADLKIADGKIEQVAKNASSQAVVATQTATKAQTTAMDASSNATVAEQTASAASVMASGANDQVAAVTLTASQAKAMATNASSAATEATVAASGAALTATNANSQAMQAIAQASQAAVTLTEVEKKANDGADQIKKLSTNLSITQKQVAETAKQTDLDKLTGRVTTQEAQSKLLSDQMSSKISRADMTDYVDGKGFATETYTQNLMKSTANTWGVNLTKLTKTVNDNQTANVKQMTNLQASLDGLQTTVTDNDKKTSSQYSQLSDALQAKVSQKDYEAKISELLGDINLRVKSKDLISQINLQAGNTLIQSGKIYLDANTIVFGKNSNAIIPNAAIGNLDAGKITMGSISVPMSDAKGTATVSVKDGKVTITGIGPGIDREHSQPGPFDPDYIGKSDVVISHEGLEFNATLDVWNDHPGTNKALGVFRPTQLDTVDTAGISYLVKNFVSDDGPQNAGDFFAIDRQGLGEYDYIHGMVYKASEDHGKVHLGFHFYDPVYIHPYGAETGIRSTWCSWSSMSNRKFPVLVNSDHGWSGIAFPAQGPAFIFSNNGYVARPSQKIDAYSGYGDGNKDWRDPTDPNQAGQTIDYSKWA